MKKLKAKDVTVNPDGTCEVRDSGTGTSAHWDASLVSQARRLSDLCKEHGKWDCDCGCCVVDSVLAGCQAFAR
jgi:hypothetical protein